MSQHYKIESERIYEGLVNLSDTIFPKTHNDSIEAYLTPENKVKGLRYIRYSLFPLPMHKDKIAYLFV